MSAEPLAARAVSRTISAMTLVPLARLWALEIPQVFEEHPTSNNGQQVPLQAEELVSLAAQAALLPPTQICL